MKNKAGSVIKAQQVDDEVLPSKIQILRILSYLKAEFCWCQLHSQLCDSLPKNY